MTYPQPSANQYAVDGAGFFRLNTRLVSPGDIYESEQSGLAFALGPQSDISDVQIAYFDDQARPSFMNQTSVSADRSFVGRLEARNESKYAPSGRQGRILFWSNDLFDPAIVINPAIIATDPPTIIQPQLDLIQYFNNPPSLVPQRADKEFNFQQIQTDIAQQRPTIVVPYYGRKYCMIDVSNASGDIFGLYVIGINYVLTDDAGPSLQHQQTLLFFSDIAGIGALNRIVTLGPMQSLLVTNPGGGAADIVTVNQGGMFDAIAFVLDFNGQAPAPTPLRIVMSDRVF